MFEFIRQYFINPILFNEGYNFVNSTTYALLFIAAVYLVFLLLKKIKIPVDRMLTLSVMPYVVFGSIVRVLEDMGIFNSYLLFTPVIWGEMLVFILFMLAISILIQKRFNVPYYKPMFLIGVMLLAISIPFLNFKNLYGMFLTSAFFIPFALVFYFIKWKPENKLVALAHIFDGIASFTAVRFFNYFEQYPTSRFLMTSISPLSFPVVKIIAIVSILILIDKISDDKEFNKYIKLIIGILGLAPGIRDFLRLAALS